MFCLVLATSSERRGPCGAVYQASRGMGESRMVERAAREAVTTQGIRPLTWRCSPLYINSALYPMSANFETHSGVQPRRAAASRLDKLETLIVGRFGQPLQDVRFIVAMLYVPSEERYGPLAMSPRLVQAKLSEF